MLASRQHFRVGLFALVLLTIVPASLTGSGNTKTVIDLKHEKFDDFIRSSTAPVLLEFFAPWCSHCRNFEMEYKRLAEKYADSPIRIARIDATSSRVLLLRFRVKQLPTFFYIHKRNCAMHVGPTTFDSLSSFIDSAGSNGESWNFVLGPFHIYWQLISILAVSSEVVTEWVIADRKNMLIAGAIVFASALGVVGVFTTFIHFLTKPPPRTRPHAD